jgi:hypothetical protein
MGQIFNNVYEIWQILVDRRMVGYFDDNYFQRIIR